MRVMKQVCMSVAMLMGLAVSQSSVAETIYFPEELIPLQVDDKKIENSFFSSVDELELEPGTYRLQLKYSDLYDVGADDHSVVKSEPFWVKLTVAQGQDYDVVFKRAATVEAAELFAEAPVVRLQAKGKKLSEPMPSVAAASVPAPEKVIVPASAVIAPDPAQPTAPVSPANAGSVSAASMLDFWWQQASEQERQAFLQKVTKK